MLSVVTTEQAHDELRLDLDQLVREGARRMLAVALEAEVDAYLAAYAAERDEQGRRLVVRNGHARERQVTTAAGAVVVRAPRVDDRRTDPVTGERVRFRSVLLPPWCRKSPKVAEVLPLLYLHGPSTGDFVAALEGFFGSGAGLSAAVITRLLTAWQADWQAFCQPDIEAEHWLPLKTSNPIESTFSSVRLRTRVTKGPGSKAAGLAMAFKLLESAQARWRAVNGPHLVALVRAGARSERGVLVERPSATGQAAA
jgi:transposase-like protein